MRPMLRLDPEEPSGLPAAAAWRQWAPDRAAWRRAQAPDLVQGPVQAQQPAHRRFTDGKHPHTCCMLAGQHYKHALPEAAAALRPDLLFQGKAQGRRRPLGLLQGHALAEQARQRLRHSAPGKAQEPAPLGLTQLSVPPDQDQELRQLLHSAVVPQQAPGQRSQIALQVQAPDRAQETAQQHVPKLAQELVGPPAPSPQQRRPPGWGCRRLRQRLRAPLLTGLAPVQLGVCQAYAT